MTAAQGPSSDLNDQARLVGPTEARISQGEADSASGGQGCRQRPVGQEFRILHCQTRVERMMHAIAACAWHSRIARTADMGSCIL